MNNLSNLNLSKEIEDEFWSGYEDQEEQPSKSDSSTEKKSRDVNVIKLQMMEETFRSPSPPKSVKSKFLVEGRQQADPDPTPKFTSVVDNTSVMSIKPD